MKVACPTCARVLTVPPDKVAIPRLLARCACGLEFAVTGPAAAPARPAPPAPAPDAPVRAPTRPVPWPRCAGHSQVRSSFVCPQCVKGYCEACVQKVQGGAICAACDGLCVTTEKYGDRQTTSEQRDRTMAQDIGLIAGYPFRDPLGFALLALFTWFFGYFAVFLSQGVLMLYTFHALTRVSNGDLKSSMPDFTDVFDLMLPARLAFAAFVISTGPLIAVALSVPGALDLFAGEPAEAGTVHAAAQRAPSAAEDDPESDESAAPRLLTGGPGPLGITLLAVTLLWKLAYTPVALTVAALSRSYLSTLNPVIGFGTIARMGATYWHAMALYTILVVVQWGVGLGLDKIPLAGPLLRSFTDAYGQLAIACTLGLAVFKKAAALGWD